MASIKEITVPPLSADQRKKLEGFKQTLLNYDVTPDKADLMQNQGRIKDQSYRGACLAMSFASAVEAFYRRKYNLAVDLSTEFWIWAVFSTQHSNNPALLHENLADAAGVCIGTVPEWEGKELMALHGITLPEERFCPYFGLENATNTTYNTAHDTADYYRLIKEAGIPDVIATGTPPNEVTTPPIPQRVIDVFNYDPRHIPHAAYRNAIYGATDVQVFTPVDVTAQFLEQMIASQHEIQIGVGFEYFGSDQGNVHSDGRPILRYMPNADGPKHGGHSMLIVGYDRNSQLLLFKNSWGANTLPYFWAPYDIILDHNLGGRVVHDVRDPASGPNKETMWIGQWRMDHDGWEGELVIRRTREVGQPRGSRARLGTYYDSNKVAHPVTGRILDQDGRTLRLCIDFGQQDGPPDPPGTQVVLKGQEFFLNMFDSPQNPLLWGNAAAGYTKWNDIKFGAFITRPHLKMSHKPTDFNVQGWLSSPRKTYACQSPKAEMTEVTDLTAQAGGGWSAKIAFAGKIGHDAQISASQPHRMNVPFLQDELLHHTREEGVAVAHGGGYILLPHGGWNGQEWSDWSAMEVNPFQGAPTPVAFGHGQVGLFVRDNQNCILFSSYDGCAPSAWCILPGQPVSSLAAVSWGLNRIDAFYRDSGNQARHFSWDGTNWSATEPISGAFRGNPAVASWGKERLDLFVRGTNNHLMHCAWEGNWGGWENLGGDLADSPAAVSWGKGRIDCIIRNTNNQLEHIAYDNRKWGGWEPLDGKVKGTPALTSWGKERLDAFTRGTNNQVMHRTWNGDWSGWKNKGGDPVDSPAAISYEYDHIAIFIHGKDGKIWHRSYW
jgi:hypothetical protein